MNRRALILLALCAVVIVAALLTRNGGSTIEAKRPGFRATKGNGGDDKDQGGRSGYDNFKLIHTRNVFDPDRRAPRTGPAPTPAPATAKADYVALTGTMFDGERKQLAFFSGSRPEYNKVLTVQDKIAGATINKITGSNVEVLRDGQPIVVMVGQTVPFDRSKPTAAPAAATPDPATTEDAPAAPGNTAAAPVVGAVPTGTAPPVIANASAPGVAAVSPKPISASKQDEVRRRMEEQRRKEQQ